MDTAAQMETLRGSAARIGVVGAQSPDAPLTTYPGHDVLDLVCHVLTIHEWVEGIVANRLTERPESRTDYDRSTDGVLDHYEDTWRRLADLLAAADPSEPVWSFGAARTVGFWQGRMAHETAMHRWDADRAIDSSPEPIPTEVAVSGLDEGLRIHFERLLRRTEIGGSGEVLAIRCTDADASWAVSLLAEGVEVRDGAPRGKTAGELSGTASDLWLAFTGRAPIGAVSTADGPAIARLETAIAALPPAL